MSNINWSKLNETGGAVTATLAVIDLTAKQGKKKPYISCTLSDGCGTISANCFEISMENLTAQGIKPGEVVTAKITASKGFLNVESMELAPSEMKDSFAVKAPIDPESTFEELCEIIRRNDNGTGLVPLTLGLLNCNKEAFIRSSAACKNHHNELGGLIWHTHRIVRCADIITDVYPKLDKCLLICGAALHDIGKIYSLATNDLGGAEMTPDGLLLEHTVIGIIMISEYAENNNITIKGDNLLKLEHMLAAHHGKLEYGAPSVPSIPEAMVLNNLDIIDSRIDMFEKLLDGIDQGSMSVYSKLLGTCAYRAIIDNNC